MPLPEGQKPSSRRPSCAGRRLKEATKRKLLQIPGEATTRGAPSLQQLAAQRRHRQVGLQEITWALSGLASCMRFMACLTQR